MAIADRLNKLRTDIEDTYQAINEIGGTIPSDKNTNNIPEAIRSVYDNLPKVSDTGTSVSLSPTLKGRLGSVLNGNTLQDGTPSPSSPVEIQSATGTQKFVVSGKNLFDKDNVKYINAYANATTGVLISASANTRTIYVPCKSNTTYTIQKGIVTPTNSNRFQIGTSASVPKAGDTLNDFWAMSDGGTITSHTITTGNNANYLVCFCYVAGTTTSWEDFIGTIQIEEGNTSTPYQPYQEPQEVDIELGNIELNKIGDYEDYIDGTPDNWVLYKNIGKVVLNGSEVWNYIAVAQGSLFRNYTATPNNSSLDNYLPISDYYKGIYYRNAMSRQDGNIYIANTSVQLDILDNRFTSDTAFKNWLSNNNVNVLYALKNAQQTPITDTNLISQLNELYYLQSYNNTTNIDVTGNLPMRMTASAIKGE